MLHNYFASSFFLIHQQKLKIRMWLNVLRRKVFAPNLEFNTGLSILFSCKKKIQKLCHELQKLFFFCPAWAPPFTTGKKKNFWSSRHNFLNFFLQEKRLKVLYLTKEIFKSRSKKGNYKNSSPFCIFNRIYAIFFEI